MVLVGLAAAGCLIGLRPWLQHTLTLRAALAETSVETGLVEELMRDDAAPLQVTRRFFETGKIPHRIAALRGLSRSATGDSLDPIPAWLQSAALDADFQVRELALGVLSVRPPAGITPLVRAALLDADPELNHVAARMARSAGLTNLIADVAGLIDRPDLNVRIAAAGVLQSWTGVDFGVRRAILGGAYNDATGEMTDASPERLARVEAGLAQWKTWWSANQTNWAHLPTPTAAKSAEPPRPAPDFALTDLAGKTVRLTDFRGRPVFINFWATWCTACWSELPELAKLHQRYGDQLVILGIALDGLPDQHELEHGHKESEHIEGDEHRQEGEHVEPADHRTPREELVKLVGGFARKQGLNYPILLDPDGSVSQLYQGNELPVNVLVDGEGHLRRRFIGPRSAEAFDAMIAELGIVPTGARH